MRRKIIGGLVWVSAAAMAAASLPLGFLVFDARRAQPNRLPDGGRVRALHDLHVPGLAAARCVVVIERA